MFRTPLTRTLLPRTSAVHPVTLRPFSTTAAFSARKGAEDKDSLQPRSMEYSQSGGDDAAAENSDAAFNPNKTRPEEETDTAGTQVKGSENAGKANPLGVSPGNKDVSKEQPKEGESAKGSRGVASGAGSAPKAGGGKSG